MEERVSYKANDKKLLFSQIKYVFFPVIVRKLLFTPFNLFAILALPYQNIEILYRVPAVNAN